MHHRKLNWSYSESLTRENLRLKLLKLRPRRAGVEACPVPRLLLICIQWMFGLVEEFVLQFQAGLVGLHSAYSIHNSATPTVHFEGAKLFCGGRTVARVVLWEARVPPNGGV